MIGCDSSNIITVAELSVPPPLKRKRKKMWKKKKSYAVSSVRYGSPYDVTLGILAAF